MTTERQSTGLERAARGIWVIVGFLVAVEFASGILQGYYTPIFSDLAAHLGVSDADLNWLEAGQLIVSALCVPPLARLGDLIGHKKVLLLATGLTAAATWWTVVAPDFGSFLVAWSIQGAYVIWLPLEVAIVHRRTNGDTALTRKAAGILVGALEISVIIGAVAAGALVGALPMAAILAIPALCVTAVFVVIALGIEPDRPTAATENSFDWAGLGVLTLVLGLVMAGLIGVRVLGAGSLLAWGLVVLGLAALWPFWKVEVRQSEPLIDVRLLVSRGQWPIQLTAFLFGMSVLGAQIPLSTFARTDPAVTGYGLGADASFVSMLIALYVITMALGAFTLPLWARGLGPMRSQAVACFLVALGYLMWLPFHGSTGQALLNMAVIGLGSGALVASLPAAAAAAAPASRTAFATGMTNATKTVGGAIASAVFAIALASTGSIGAEAKAPLSGYLTVWAVCGLAAAVAGALLLLARAAPADDTL
ncbi:MFS transporter [Nocardioides sp. KC13]|uniref:MFS transporter n=1 Tax=Nocardioides turkmenicus TaxID=2711220 RepID=A0A6M1R7S5_9ACTN|nr:MFS transporter [Nocardioides sp. KC13]